MSGFVVILEIRSQRLLIFYKPEAQRSKGNSAKAVNVASCVAHSGKSSRVKVQRVHCIAERATAQEKIQRCAHLVFLVFFGAWRFIQTDNRAELSFLPCIIIDACLL